MAETETSPPGGSIEVPAHAEHAQPALVGMPDTQMMILTWVTFAIVAFVLYKKAWKPILAGLDKREADIRQAVDNAARIRDELAEIEARRQASIAQADAQAKSIVEAARVAATKTADLIEGKAREEAQILLENAQREIRAERDRAMAALRSESAELVIGLTRKVLRDQLDEARGRAVVNQVIGKA